MTRTRRRMLVAFTASWTLLAGFGLAQGREHGGFGGRTSRTPGFKRGDREREWKRDYNRDRDDRDDYDREGDHRDRDEHHGRHQRSHHADRRDDDDRYGRSGRPPGWTHGRKTGWGGCDVPPGLAKKEGCHDRKSVERRGVATARQPSGLRPPTVTVRRRTPAPAVERATRKGTVVKNTTVKKATVKNATPSLASAPKVTKVGPWVQVGSRQATRDAQRR